MSKPYLADHDEVPPSEGLFRFCGSLFFLSHAFLPSETTGIGGI